VDFDLHAVYRGVRTTAGGTYAQTLRLDVVDLTFFQFGVVVAKDDGSSVISTTWTGASKPDTITAKYYEAYF